MAHHFKFILSSLFLFIFVQSCNVSSQRTSSTHDNHTHQPDTPAVHGMLVFGSKHIWLSHLPMFHKPHDYQVIMSVTLKKDGKDLQSAYLADQAQSRAAYYSFVPKRFSMTHLVAGTLTSFEMPSNKRTFNRRKCACNKMGHTESLRHKAIVRSSALRLVC